MADEFLQRTPHDLTLADLPRPEAFGDMGEDVSPFERAAIRQRRAVLRGRDAPDRVTDPATLASLTAGFLPFSGMVDAFGAMPDFRGGNEPSLLENWRQGNRVTAAAQAMGAVPVLGVVPKIARASMGAQRLAARTPIFDHSLRRADQVAQVDLPRKAPTKLSHELISLLNSPKLEEEMLKIIEFGKSNGATNWYNTEPLRQEFIKELGPQGEEAYRKYLRYVAATSAVSDVGPNVRNGSYYFGLDRREGRVPAVGDRNPPPYGHYAARNHQIFAQKVIDDQFDPTVYPKMSSFYENLTGNYAPVTVDRHALRLPAMLAGDKNFLKREYREMLDNGKVSMDELVRKPAAWRNPNADEYPALEAFYKRVAKKAGLLPAEGQAAAWVGGSDRTGVRDNGLLSFMQHFEDRLDLTAKEKGISRAEALRRFIHGKMDLVSLDQQPNAVV
jgi:hypothetical protein